MMIFLYETGSEATKINTLKIFRKIKLFFWPFWRLVGWRHIRALVLVTIFFQPMLRIFQEKYNLQISEKAKDKKLTKSHEK